MHICTHLYMSACLQGVQTCIHANMYALPYSLDNPRGALVQHVCTRGDTTHGGWTLHTQIGGMGTLAGVGGGTSDTTLVASEQATDATHIT